MLFIIAEKYSVFQSIRTEEEGPKIGCKLLLGKKLTQMGSRKSQTGRQKENSQQQAIKAF